jgi:GT2 family glycosyltransferase
MISIIVPVKGLKEVVQSCIDSIRNYTEDYELIIVNDGSDDETSAYLESIDAKYVKHDKSYGWCRSINDGIKEASGEFIVFSNSDVVYTPNWARRMLEHFEKISDLGVLGPTTNQVANHQHMALNRDELFEFSDTLIFFCVMIRRKVINKIGGLDEQFDPGGMEDADYCIMARKAGFKVGIARNVFIYHYGSATFRQEFGYDAPNSREFAQSRVNLLEKKWNKKVYIAIPTTKGGIVPGLVNALVYWSHHPEIRVNKPYHIPEGLFPLDNARNTVIKEFRELDFDYLWWIDDDIVPPPNAMERMVNTLEARDDIDSLGAACFSMKSDSGDYFPYPVTLRYNEDKQYEVYYGQGVEQVDATGGACVMMKRHIFDNVERPYEFVYHRDGTLALTCDFKVWQKLEETGYKLFIDFDILCDHQRPCSIKSIQDMMVKMQKS